MFGYTVTDADTDDDGVAVPADGIRLAGGTIADAQGGAAALGHDAVAADPAHKVDGGTQALTGGVCERTPQVRVALVAAAQANDAAVADCSGVDVTALAGIAGTLRLDGLGIAALKPGDLAGLSAVTSLLLNDNALSALPAGVFDGLGAVRILRLTFNALGAGSIEDGVFEPLIGLSTLDLSGNPGSASFVPQADAGEDLVLRAGETATLGGPGTGGGPWGMNVDYTWVEIDADDNPVAEAERTEDLSAANVASPVFTAPALAAERVLRYRFTVQGRGHGGTDDHSASDTVTVTVRAAPAVTAVALTSVPQADATYREGETIEVSVTFSAPVTVTGTPAIGLEVGTAVRPAAYVTKSAPHVLVFGYTVIEDEMDTDGVAVPANGIALAGGTIADAHGVAALLGHAAVAADAAHMVDGDMMALTGGVCDRTLQVRDALVAAVAAASDCSEVSEAQLKVIEGTLLLNSGGIVALKVGDFKYLEKVEGLNLSGNALSALPAAVFGDLTGLTSLDLSGNVLTALPRGLFDPLTSLTALHLNSNALAEGGLPDGVFEKLPEELTTLDPAPESGQRELRAAGRRGCLRGGRHGGRQGGRGRSGARSRDPGRLGHARRSVGNECQVQVGRGRRAGQRGRGGGGHGGPLRRDRGRGALHRAGADRGAGAALPADGDRQGARRRAAPSTGTVRAPRCRSRSGPAARR